MLMQGRRRCGGFPDVAAVRFHPSCRVAQPPEWCISPSQRCRSMSAQRLEQNGRVACCVSSVLQIGQSGFLSAMGSSQRLLKRQTVALAGHLNDPEIRQFPNPHRRLVAVKPACRASIIGAVSVSGMSIKSTAIRPPTARKRICRAISDAASRLTSSAASF